MLGLERQQVGEAGIRLYPLLSVVPGVCVVAPAECHAGSKDTGLSSLLPATQSCSNSSSTTACQKENSLDLCVRYCRKYTGLVVLDCGLKRGMDLSPLIPEFS